MNFTLNTKDLLQFVTTKNNLKTKVSIFPIDKLPPKIMENHFLIVNSEPSISPGRHWIVMHFPQQSIPEFCDSLGKCPSFYSYTMLDYLIQNNNYGFVYNYDKLQNDESTNCGVFCLYFIYHRIKGVSFKNIMKRFYENENENEDIIRDFYLGYLKKQS